MKLTSDQITSLKDLLEIDQSTTKRRISCPIHDDSTASSDIDFASQDFHCWGCKERLSLYELVIKMGQNGFDVDDIIEIEDEDQLSEETIEIKSEYVSYEDLLKLLSQVKNNRVKGFISFNKPFDPNFFNDRLKNFILSRCIEQQTYLDNLYKIEIEKDIKSVFYGYIKFYTDENNFVARLFIKELEFLGRPKYRNSDKFEKKLFGLDKCNQDEDRLLVEGLFDFLTLKQIGFTNVICTFGSEVKEEILFSLRNIEGTNFLMFDGDLAGLKASTKIQGFAAKYNIPIINLEFPAKKLKIKDSNEALMKQKSKELKEWILSQLETFSSNDVPFVRALLSGNTPPMKVYTSGLPTLDGFLSGGFSEGVHAIAAMPGAGKTAFCCYLTNHFFFNLGAKVLYATYEISRRQIWARLISAYSQHTWVDIEKDPNIVTGNDKELAEKMATSVRVLANKDINSVIKAMDNFDIMILDYLQVMPKPEGMEDRSAINYIMTKLAEFTATTGKIVLLVNSIPRNVYGKETLAMKESGNIDFAIATAIILSKINENSIKLSLVKSRRGVFPKSLTLRCDLSHGHFIDDGDSMMVDE